MNASSKKVYLVPSDMIMEGNHGICLACGHIQDGCEPDAEKYHCEDCQADQVYGMENALLMGYLLPSEEETVPPNNFCVFD